MDFEKCFEQLNNYLFNRKNGIITLRVKNGRRFNEEDIEETLKLLTQVLDEAKTVAEEKEIFAQIVSATFELSALDNLRKSDARFLMYASEAVITA